MVGLVLSGNQGEALRSRLGEHPGLKVRAKVDVRRYAGSHDVVSGILRGHDPAAGEIWAVAHSASPVVM